MIHSRSILSTEANHGSCWGSDSFRAAVNQCCETWDNASALLNAYLTNTTSMDRLYSFIVSVNMASCLRINISLNALVVSHALLVSASDIQCWVHAKSMTMCSTVACHCSAGLILFRVASSLARFICCMSLSASRHLYDRPVILKGNTHGQWVDIHPNSELVPVNTPVTSYRIVLHHSLHSFSYHASQGNFVHLVIPSWRNRSHAMLYGCCHHFKPATYGKMAYQFPTHGEGAPMSGHWQDFRDITASLPTKFFSM